MTRHIKEVTEAVYQELVSKAQYWDLDSWRKPLEKTMKTIKNACNGDIITISSKDAYSEASMLATIAVEMAKTGKKVLYFCNMDGEETALSRMLAIEGLVPLLRIIEGGLTAEEWKRLAQAAISLNGLDIYFAPKQAVGKDIPEIVEEIGAVDFIVIENVKSSFRRDVFTEPCVIEAKKIANKTGSVFVCGTNGLWGGDERLKCSNKVLTIWQDDNPESENPNLCRLEWEDRFRNMQRKEEFNAIWLYDFGYFRDIDRENFGSETNE